MGTHDLRHTKCLVARCGRSARMVGWASEPLAFSAVSVMHDRVTCGMRACEAVKSGARVSASIVSAHAPGRPAGLEWGQGWGGVQMTS